MNARIHLQSLQKMQVLGLISHAKAKKKISKFKINFKIAQFSFNFYAKAT